MITSRGATQIKSNSEENMTIPLTDTFFGRPGIEYHFNGIVRTHKFEGVFAIMLDWRKSDPQIRKALGDKILIYRPDEFRSFAKTSRKQNPFGHLCAKLPFRPTSALTWLGVSRRHNRVKTWRKYFELYHPCQLQNCGPGGIKSTEIDALARPREEDIRKTRLILDWLENGTPLQPKAFK